MTQDEKNKLKITISNKANAARIAIAAQKIEKSKKTVIVQTKNKKGCDCDRKG